MVLVVNKSENTIVILHAIIQIEQIRKRRNTVSTTINMFLMVHNKYVVNNKDHNIIST